MNPASLFDAIITASTFSLPPVGDDIDVAADRRWYTDVALQLNDTIKD